MATPAIEYLASVAPQVVAIGCLVWCVGVALIQAVGIATIFRCYSSPPRPPRCSRLPLDQVPHVTAIRPVSGLEPELRACLVSSTFLQDYPHSRLSIRFCVESESDPAYPLLRELVDRDFSGFDAQVLVEARDPLLHGPPAEPGPGRIRLGPNQKIRNISRAYREALGDIIWMADSNAWEGRHACGHMVDRLMGMPGPGGRPTTTPYKFVHQLPLLVAADDDDDDDDDRNDGNDKGRDNDDGAPSPSRAPGVMQWWRLGGGRLDEMFFSTTHAKFYAGFNSVGAPCVMGKSNMFRKSDLDLATDPDCNPHLAEGASRQPVGIDHFSSYICEDHLIGERLWRYPKDGPDGNHALALGSLVLQPMRDMTVPSYVARRIRWLRARKWTVLLATLLEPGVESLLWSAYLAYAATTLPWLGWLLGGVAPTWAGAAAVWSTAVAAWCAVDYCVYTRLHSGRTVVEDVDDGTTPRFVARCRQPRPGPPLWQWLLVWAGREVLALPIWAWAFFRPTVVTWRGRRFKVASDMSVVECEGGEMTEKQKQKKRKKKNP